MSLGRHWSLQRPLITPLSPHPLLSWCHSLCNHMGLCTGVKCKISPDACIYITFMCHCHLPFLLTGNVSEPPRSCYVQHQDVPVTHRILSQDSLPSHLETDPTLSPAPFPKHILQAPAWGLMWLNSPGKLHQLQHSLGWGEIITYTKSSGITNLSNWHTDITFSFPTEIAIDFSLFLSSSPFQAASVMLMPQPRTISIACPSFATG